jgi:hypothetical protein
VTERLPDRLRDQLYFAMASFRDRVEVSHAVNNGRAVDDPRLAARAVARARRMQDGKLLRWRRPAFVLIGVFWLGSAVAERDWILIPIAAAFLVLGTVRLRDVGGKVRKAEEENARLL